MAAAVAKLLLNKKLRFAAVKAPRDAVLNNLGRTIVCFKKLVMFHLDYYKREEKKCEHFY